MVSESDQKLQQARGLLTTLIAEFNGVISEMRDLQPWEVENGEPDYLRTMLRQRDTLNSAAEILADLQSDVTGCDSGTGALGRRPA